MHTDSLPARSRLPSGLTILGLVGLLVVALWLRWRYVQEISLYVDEFTTLWAARRILDTGAPLMPSGVLYTRGLLASYVTALFAAAGGLTYTVGRLPSVLFGLGSILAIFAVGRREWNARVAWLAAIGLALLPEAIAWSGRARFYAQLQFFVLLTIWAAYAAVRAERSDVHNSQFTIHNSQFLFAALFTLSLFSQEQTILIYPPLLLGMVLWRGWRYLLNRRVWPAQVICLAAMALRYAIEVLGQPGYFETIQARRPYVGLIFDPLTAWAAYARLFVAPERLLWTLAGVFAVAVALVALARARWRPTQLPDFHQATLFFALPFAFVLAVMLTLVGGQWRETRYLFLVQPCWLLLGAAGAIWLVDRVAARPALRWAATGLLAGLIVVTLWQPAQAVLTQQVEGYDRTLAYVAANRQAGDVVMSPQPPACALVLGPCDYYTVQKAYEEFVIPQDGVLVDRWSGAKLLDNAQQLREVVEAAPRTWFVADGFRLATRYDPDFLRTVIEQFDIAFEERGVMALLAQGWRAAPLPTAQQALDTPARFGPLALTGWERSEAAPGQDLHLTTLWQGVEPIDRQINTSARVTAADGTRVAQTDGPPARGIIPTHLFFGAPLPDPKLLALPSDLPAGRYRIDVSAYDVDTVTPSGGSARVGLVSRRAAAGRTCAAFERGVAEWYHPGWLRPPASATQGGGVAPAAPGLVDY